MEYPPCSKSPLSWDDHQCCFQNQDRCRRLRILYISAAVCLLALPPKLKVAFEMRKGRRKTKAKKGRKTTGGDNLNRARRFETVDQEKEEGEEDAKRKEEKGKVFCNGNQFSAAAFFCSQAPSFLLIFMSCLMPGFGNELAASFYVAGKST